MHFLHNRELYSFAVFTIMITIISTVVSLVGLGIRDCPGIVDSRCHEAAQL